MPLFQHTVQPLRQLILRRVGVLIVCVTLLVAACFFWFGLRPMAEQLAREQFDSAAARVDAGLSAFFAPPVRLLAMSRSWMNGRAPDLVSPQAFNAVFQPVLQEYEQLTSVVAGSSDGQGWLLLQQAGGSWRNRMTDIGRWGTQRHLLLEHTATGQTRQFWSEQTYDPRLRPWYQGAMLMRRDKGVHWTAPYTFFTTGDPGITASARMSLVDGRDFVLGFDLTLRDLSKLTLGANVGMDGLALVVTDDERVLALPAKPASVDSADWHKRLLQPASALGVAAVTDGLRRWRAAQRPDGEVLGFESAGIQWLVSARPYKLGELQLWNVVLAPASDFAPAWQPIALALVLALLLLMVMVFGLVRASTLALSKSLESLAQASRRIGQLDFDGEVQTRSQVAEIVALADSQQNMRTTLRDNQRELDARAQARNQQVAALRQAEARLQQQNAQLNTIIEHFPGGVLVVGADLQVLAFNTQLSSMQALPEELTRQPNFSFEDLLRFHARRGDYGPVDVEQLVADRLVQVRSGQPYRFERVLPNGNALEIIRTPLPQGGFVTIYMDVTEARRHQRELEYLAHFDALTALPNRVLLADRLRQGMAQVQRRGQQLGVAYLDLDGFKFINDTHGHDMGDQMLLVLAGRMKQALREGDTLARLGGDEFVAVMMDMDGPQDAVPLLTRLLATVDTPVTLLGHALRVSASVGVTFFPQGEEVDAEQLLRQADQAMYQAKQAGKNRFQYFDAAHDLSQRDQLEGLQRVRAALLQREFVLYYQPKVNMRSGVVVGAEALIRWQHPERGLLAPAAFLPLIEDHPLAVDVGQWVIDTALAQMRAWLADGIHIPVSVNVGARQLQHAGFVDNLRASLAAHPEVNPADLQMEVLETSALEDMVHVTQSMAQCRTMGVQFALDDFGTGYSSLTYLKRLPVTQIKIDQSFVRDMLDDPDDLSILVGVLDMSASFHRQVIAEGVETVEHGLLLLRLGCDLAQGYGIARPMPASDLPGWAAAWQCHPMWKGVKVVSRQHMPLLFASAEHRAWVLALEAFLKGESESTVVLDRLRCNVGQWTNDGGLRGQTNQRAVEEVVALHQQIHALGANLCELKVQNQSMAAQLQLPQIKLLRDALLAQLELLLLERSQPG
jgi:diguanylate cyclase (GGDEF)-like protein